MKKKIFLQNDYFVYEKYFLENVFTNMSTFLKQKKRKNRENRKKKTVI